MENWDAIIIGGGPAGSTCAITLAKKGRKVLLLEKGVFPRFHIGESQLPFMNKLLQNLNLLEEANKQNFIKKTGAEFVNRMGNTQRMSFTEQGSGWISDTFQVERAEFDYFLLKQARAIGATIYENTKVNKLLFKNNRLQGVMYEQDGKKSEAYASFIIDASGRNGIVAHHYKLRKINNKLQNIALFRHYENYNETYFDGIPGDIQVAYDENRWMWTIPISENRISVGLVINEERLREEQKNATNEEIFEAYLQLFPRVQKRLTSANPIGKMRIESNFCYYAESLIGPNYLLVGDSGCFVDPMFSGGVFLAMATGMKAGETLDQILNKQNSEQQLLQNYENFYKTGYDTYLRFLYWFYESNCDFYKALNSIPTECMEGTSKKALTQLAVQLACGNYWSENLLTAYLRSQEKYKTFKPFTAIYECPSYSKDESRS